MRRLASLPALLAAVPWCAAQDASLPEEVLRLARLKRVARETLARLPDFTCLETIHREHSAGPKAPFRPVDTVQVEVAQTGNREAFAWPGKPFEASHLSQMVSGALTSNGDFALHARDLFVNDHALFGSAGAESLTGRETFRYDFELPTLWSGWNVSVGRASGVVGVRGSIWAERESLRVLRMELHGMEIPPQLPVTAVSTAVEYGTVWIAGTAAWLPQAAETQIVSLVGETDRNRMEFSHCRAYGAQSALRFEAEAGSTEAPLELNLRAGLAVPIRLTTAVDSRTAKVGDPVEAQVDADIRDHSEVVLPKGARITGRVRRLERYREPAPHFIVSLEFTTVEADSRRASFFGQLQQTERLVSVSRTRAAAELPGVGTFLVDGLEFLLPAGWPMTWRTVRVGR